MVASGISPLDSEVREERRICSHSLPKHVIPFQSDEYAHCCDLVDFAIEMKQKLEEINKHSFNRFQLRIGEKCNDASDNSSQCHRPCLATF